MRTRLGGGEVETAHPSYQAWSYAAMIEDFNETVRHEHIALKPCAYLHNLDDGRVLNDARYAEHTARAPVFISSDAQRLTDFLKQHVRYGDSRDIMYRIEHGRIRPSKSLADSLASMLKGNGAPWGYCLKAIHPLRLPIEGYVPKCIRLLGMNWQGEMLFPLYVRHAVSRRSQCLLSSLFGGVMTLLKWPLAQFLRGFKLRATSGSRPVTVCKK